MKKLACITILTLFTVALFGQKTIIAKKVLKSAKKEVASIQPRVKKSPCEVWHSKSFTPENSRRPESFLPDFKNCAGTRVEFWIVDHNGTVVFKSNNLNTGWDGKINNKPAPQDKYMWQLRMLENNKNWMNSMGAIELVRETQALASY